MNMEKLVNEIIYHYFACINKFYLQPIDLDEIKIPVSLFVKTVLLATHENFSYDFDAMFEKNQMNVVYPYVKDKIVKDFLEISEDDGQFAKIKKYVPCGIEDLDEGESVLFARCLWINDYIVQDKEQKWFAFLTLKVPYYVRFENNSICFKKLFKKYIEELWKGDWENLNSDNIIEVTGKILNARDCLIEKYSQYTCPSRNSYTLKSYKSDYNNDIKQNIMTFLKRDMRCA